MANAQPMMIDAETVHNWSQRYSHIRTGQLGELSQDVRAAILRAVAVERLVVEQSIGAR